jgi:tetratricopeptide (TPR) repeat protein
VAITTAGVHTAGLTAINREGITVFTHAHFGRRVRLSGKPVVTIGNEIARKARTLDEAIDLARKNLPCANWAFVVASAKEQAAIVIEMNPDKAAVRHAEDGFIAHSNYFHDKELREDEALISGGICEDLEGRLCRLRDILEADRGRLEPSHLSRALGDHVDHFTGEERVYGNTISVVTTIKSTVFDPEQQRFWISTRGESPMGLGEFMEVDIDRFWKDKPEETLARKKIPGYTPKKPGLLEGIHHYREAYREWHMNCHEPDFAERCYIALKKATRAFPSDPNVWFQAGIVALKLHKFDEARNCFEQSLPFKTARHVTEVRNLYLARCYDLAGERAKALDIYGRFSQIGEPRLRKAYEHGMRRPYRERDTARMMLDLQFPDTLQY